MKLVFISCIVLQKSLQSTLSNFHIKLLMSAQSFLKYMLQSLVVARQGYVY